MEKLRKLVDDLRTRNTALERRDADDMQGLSDVEVHLITDKLTYKLRCGADAPEGTMQRWFDELVIPPPPPRLAPCERLATPTAGPS